MGWRELGERVERDHRVIARTTPSTAVRASLKGSNCLSSSCAEHLLQGHRASER